MRGRLRRATIKLLALTILFPITFSLTSTQMIRGIHQLSIPLHGYGSREFRMNNLCSHSGSTTISSEIPPEPLQVVSLAEDLPFWLELQGEVFDGSAQIHELKRWELRTWWFHFLRFFFYAPWLLSIFFCSLTPTILNFRLSIRAVSTSFAPIIGPTLTAFH